MAAHLHLAPGQADEGPLVEGNLPQLGGLPGEGLQLLGHGPGDTRGHFVGPRVELQTKVIRRYAKISQLGALV